MFEADPLLGEYVAHHPSDRLRLLLQAGSALAVVWFVTTVALLNVEAAVASTITVGIIAAASLALGWYLAHLWNREVVVYARGFSYREGSAVVYVPYNEVRTLRQLAERRTYFGGLLRRTIYRVDMTTIRDEHITLTPLYRRMDALSQRLEAETARALRPAIEKRLAEGERVPFGDTLALSAEGLHEAGRDLPWARFDGFSLQGGRLVLAADDNPDWYSVPLRAVDNLRLLLALLAERQTEGRPA
jgi:hypothetical protein